ncbi:MAG: hypothetical protein JWN43_20 [Gammaproteobacteria bacterium]|jgi:hypothetical protein|nr:hypothetical protein [Gammaproteobacteria bacterium]
MGSSRPRNSTRAKKARSVKPSPKPGHKPTLPPAAMAKRLAKRKRATRLSTAAVDALRAHRDGDKIRTPAPADDTADLFAILGALVNATCLIITATRSLEHRESAWDEITTLEAGIKMLRHVDAALNDVADGRPSRIRPDEDEDGADDEEVGHD